MVISLIRSLPAPLVVALLILAAVITTATVLYATAHGTPAPAIKASGGSTHFWG